jgi:predicted DNA-binding transcriptional regulator AlpA
MSSEKNPPTWPTESLQERLVPAQEFAERLAIRRRTLGHRIHEGSVPPPIRLHGRLYWQQSIVEQFIRGLAN